ncbi:MAG: DUF349 domain-containing protein [Bacteroidetes bacterium]|nr:DUF349 domain-containing protein [Fibrella sp.]
MANEENEINDGQPTVDPTATTEQQAVPESEGAAQPEAVATLPTPAQPEESATASAPDSSRPEPVSTVEATDSVADEPVAGTTPTADDVQEADPAPAEPPTLIAGEVSSPPDDTPATLPSVADTDPSVVPAGDVASDSAAPETTPVAEESTPTEASESIAPADEVLASVDQPVSTGAEPVNEGPAEAAEQEDLDRKLAETHDLEAADETPAQPATDYSKFTKQDFVTLLDGQLTALKADTVSPGAFKKSDDLLKEVRPMFDLFKQADRQAALTSYKEANDDSEEGFEFKYDETVQQFDTLFKQIRTQKNTYFQNLDKAKDTNFETKTDLLRRLRELVESDENSAGDAKVSWNEFKKIQDDWKAAGNLNSPHNATLWATYHALVDRYYSNRNIYFELKELDRKRNIGLKTEVIEKVEAMAKDSDTVAVTRQTIEEANTLFEEYKHIGPAPKTDQEVLWQRMKAALDTLYDKRRGESENQRKESAQLYEEKSKLYESLIPLTSFASNSINDWNDKTKEVMAIQDQWNALRGPMPREEGKELSKKFWAALKSFFHNKSEFFRQLEGKREQNLQQKVELCEQVEAILEAADESPEATQRVIELQRQWKNIGQVPEKQKNTIFDRFKAACDAFFNKKRSKNQETEREFEGNLAKKIALVERIEAAAASNADLSQLNEFKREWASIGFVPKKDMQSIQKRYVAAVNSMVGANGKLSTKEKEKFMLDTEVDVARERNYNSGSNYNAGSGGGNREGDKREGDIRRKITLLENDIATYNNNIEFFARSKNADKLRADIDRKVAAAQKQLDELKHQLKVVREAQ